jgi:hypothetical protein
LGVAAASLSCSRRDGETVHDPFEPRDEIVPRSKRPVAQLNRARLPAASADATVSRSMACPISATLVFRRSSPRVRAFHVHARPPGELEGRVGSADGQSRHPSHGIDGIAGIVHVSEIGPPDARSRRRR